MSRSRALNWLELAVFLAAFPLAVYVSPWFALLAVAVFAFVATRTR